MKECVGKGGISAKIIADSISRQGHRITTYELEYPRFILAELNTHRQFSRNSASSRAIPVARMLEMIRANPAMPVFWGANQAGMAAAVEVEDKEAAERAWREAGAVSVNLSETLAASGLHKQYANRASEAFQRMKTVLTATEFSNFFWLRNHGDAQPEIAELARVMFECYSTNQPKALEYGDWHVPYYDDGIWTPFDVTPLEDALAISSSCAAQVSYRRLDDSLEKARDIEAKLIGADRKHASPFEHQATVMGKNETELFIMGIASEGVTHQDRNGNCWSGNFMGWIQRRQLIPGHCG